MTIRWLNRLYVDQFHRDALDEHGGSYGYLNEDNLESALARPKNLHLYEGITDVFVLAARYCIGLTQAHAYVDGNKRTAFIAALVFLGLNGQKFQGDPAEAVTIMESIASNQINETEVIDWLKRGCNFKD